ncbi:hypothetical protein KAW18_12685 [candidate division WOR-3 bacterium]|nr:hypothetical protein [candidate division WOR-3 bacterium]
MITDNGKMKELKIFIKKSGIQKRISTWRFFPNLGFCFRMNGQDWENFEYERGMQICKRVMNTAKTERSILLQGTMIDELEKEDRVSKLFSGEKIVLG